jgi:hypothetical protein
MFAVGTHTKEERRDDVFPGHVISGYGAGAPEVGIVSFSALVSNRCSSQVASDGASKTSRQMKATD